MSAVKMMTAGIATLLALGGPRIGQAQGAGADAQPPSTPSAAIQSTSAMPAYVSAAVADPARPAADRARDHDRKPDEVVAFAGVKPGDTVVDFIPGHGYFTRIFSKIVGPNGQVVAFVPTFLAEHDPAGVNGMKAIAAQPGYGNVSVVVGPYSDLTGRGPVDVVWTAQNYHDMHNPAVPASTASMVDRLAFTALRPGGVFIVEDHAAEPGAGVRDAGTLHRISESTVRDEVEAAGFTFEAESPVLRNPADPHTIKVFDPSIRGHTDQFVLKFRKPS